MVSNALRIPQEDVLQALERARNEQSGTPQYKKLRQDLPKDWPL